MEDQGWEELAGQLKSPSGEKGIAVADMMHQTNINMTIHAIDALKLSSGDRVLELGHGNAGHLPYLFGQADNLRYTGLEVSELMHAEAQQIHAAQCNDRIASFELYDGINIPFGDQLFDKIFTVNTVYFWQEPIVLMTDLRRILVPGGLLNVTFADQQFMQQLPFVQFGFTLYDSSKIEVMAVQAGFKVAGVQTRKEWVKSKTGDKVQRIFSSVSLV